MKSISQFLTWIAAAVIVVGCATVDDIRTANSLIQTDNELQRLVMRRVEADTPQGVQEAKASLIALGSDARKRGDALAGEKSYWREAVSYYRIAATAFWQSRAESAVSDMFEAAERGKEICGRLGNEAPDRDRLFLSLIIPFAALEKGLEDALMSLNGIDHFSGGQVTDERVKALNAVYGELKTAHKAIEAIDSLQGDPAVTGHPEFQAYYDENRAEIHRKYENRRTELEETLARLTRLNNALPPGERKPASFTMEDLEQLEFNSP